jgi:hypothetical protein
MGTINLEAAATKLPIIDGTNPPRDLRVFLVRLVRLVCLGFLALRNLLVLRLPPVVLIAGRTIEDAAPNKLIPAPLDGVTAVGLK